MQFYLSYFSEKIKCSKMLFLSRNQVEMIQNANTGIRPMTKAPFLNSKKDISTIETLLLFFICTGCNIFLWNKKNMGVKTSEKELSN